MTKLTAMLPFYHLLKSDLANNAYIIFRHKTEAGDIDDKAADKFSWTETGFNLVTRIGSHGALIDGIYAVQHLCFRRHYRGDA